MRFLALFFLYFLSFSANADCKLNTLTFNEKTNTGFICTNYKDRLAYEVLVNSFCNNYYSLQNDVLPTPEGFTFNCIIAMFQVENPKENITKDIPDLRKANESPDKYIAPKNQVKIKVDTEKEKLEKINSAKIKCSEIGYIKGSDRFNKCVLEIFQ